MSSFPSATSKPGTASFPSQRSLPGSTSLPAGITVDVVQFQPTGSFSSGSEYTAATDAVGPNGGYLYIELVYRTADAYAGQVWPASVEISRKGDPDSGWTMQVFGSTTQIRLRHHDNARVPSQVGGLVSGSSDAGFHHVLFVLDGTSGVGNSYHNGQFVGTTTISVPDAPADPLSLLIIPAANDNPYIEFCYEWLSDSSTTTATIASDLDAWNRFSAVKAAMLAGTKPTNPASFGIFADASQCNVGTAPQNWVLTGSVGGTISSPAGTAPALKFKRPVSFAQYAFPAPTMTSPTNGQAVTAGNNVTLTTTFARDTLVSRVDWYATIGGVTSLVGTDSASPWTQTWTSPAVGSYSVFSRATYIDGSTADTAAAAVTVTAVQTPAQIFGADLISFRTGDDATALATLLTAWPDEIGGAAVTIVATPHVTASDARFNNKQVVLFDGVGDLVTFACARPAPATTPTTIFAIMLHETITSGDACWGEGNNIMALNQITTTALIRNTTAGPSAAISAGAAKLHTGQYTGSTVGNTDVLKIGAASANGNAGNTAPGGTMAIGGRPTANFGNVSVRAFGVVQRTITAGEQAALEVWAANDSGAGVIT